VAKLFLPYGLVTLTRRFEERRRIAKLLSLIANPRANGAVPRFDYEDAVAFLVDRGLPENAVRYGSIPAMSLSFVRHHIQESFAGSPIRVLHVGNFVGLSLAAVTAVALEVSSESIVVSVDPNIPHLGVADPQLHCLALLAHLGLDRSSVVMCGYSLEKIPSSDGNDGTDNFANEAAPQNVLQHLVALEMGFDVVLIDGTHLGDYASREVQLVSILLREGGLLILDDAWEAWHEIQQLFEAAERGSAYERAGHDGRVGILRRLLRTAERS
jgi:hypothetical protein